MPFISKEQVKTIRETLKAKFPGFKFSVVKRDHVEVSVTILEAPFNLLLNKEKGYEGVNPYYIAENYKDMPEAAEVLQQIMSIMNKGNGTVSVDGDYGNIPKFYINIRIGDWDRNFRVTEPNN